VEDGDTLHGQAIRRIERRIVNSKWRRKIAREGSHAHVLAYFDQRIERLRKEVDIIRGNNPCPGPPSAYDSCRTCHGSGLEVVGGRTPEGDVMDDVECSTCKGTGKRPL